MSNPTSKNKTDLKSKVLYLRIDPKTKATLQSVADKEKRSLTNMCMVAFDECISKRLKSEDV